MSEQLNERLNQILPILTSDSFLNGGGIGNEIAFYIFEYAPEDELAVRKHIRFLLEHLQKNRKELRVGHINLFDFLIDYLRERNLLSKAFELQREKGNRALLNALKGVLHEERIAKRFEAKSEPADHDLILISGVGAAYPLIRSHTLLSNLHSVMGQTPLVMFYPGTYDTQTLRLFGKSGLTGDSAKERNRTGNYYRAFRLID